MRYDMTQKKAQGNNLHGRNFSLRTVVLLSCAALYILVLGTQFKIMSILGEHHATTNSPGADHGEHISLTGVKSRMTSYGGGKAIHVKKSLDHRRQQQKQTAERNIDSAWQHVGQSQLHKTTAASFAHNIDTQHQNIADDQQQSQLYKTMAASIAGKWNLTTPNAVELLEQQFYKENDYDPKNDFFHFHHLYKSGGTSLSTLLDKTVGLPLSANGKYEGILPGSYQSGNFNHEEALLDINRRKSLGIDLSYKASYAHTGLRPVYGPRRTKTGIFFLKHLPPRKRLRVITMLRDPTDFRASNHGELYA